MYSFVAFLLLLRESLAQTGFDAYGGWAQSEFTTYSTQTTPCNVDNFVSSLPSGYGYYSDPGVVGGWCKSILPQHVDSIRSEYAAEAWTPHGTGVTYLPHAVISAYTKIICQSVVSNSYALADGTPSSWTYSSLDECFDKCNNDPLCVGFLDRSPGDFNGKVCSWKSDESNLAFESSCENDYYRKGTYSPSRLPTLAPTACNYDACGVCDGDSSTCTDCAGVPNGGSTDDACGVCNGDSSSCTDCNGVANGGATEDACGVCNGDSLSCADCSGVANGNAVVDDCGVCGGDGSSCTTEAPLTLCENKDNSPNITDTFDEVVCLCTEYKNDGWSWSRNELTDDLERKIRMLANAGGELTDGSPMFLMKWKMRMNYHVYLHDSADDDTVNNVLYHRRVWRKVCLSTTRRRSMMREFALKIDEMNM